MSQKFAVNEVMETIPLTHNSHTESAEPLCEAAYEKDLFSLFNKYSNLMSPYSD